jgi:hypothetical protein
MQLEVNISQKHNLSPSQKRKKMFEKSIDSYSKNQNNRRKRTNSAKSKTYDANKMVAM